MTFPQQLQLDPKLLAPNPWNTNIMTPESEAKLEASIARLGFFRPVVVRELANSSNSYQILGGAHRAQIAQKLGLPSIPVMNLGPIDDLKAKEIGIADNARYGVDDTIAFAELIKEMGNQDELTEFLPYQDTDFADLFAATAIDLDSLELEETETSDPSEEDEPEQPKPVKTHTIMSFKVTNADAERITHLVEATKKAHGFTASDEKTNAGDALVHILLSGTPAAQAPAEKTLWGDPLDEVDDLEGVLE